MMLNYREIQRNGRILIILLFSCFCSAQKIIVDNKSGFPIEIGYLQNSSIINSNEKKIFQEKFEITEVGVLKNNKTDSKINIPLFLSPKETLTISVNKNNIDFNGDKDSLHAYIYNKLRSDLFMNIGDYQKNYQKGNANVVIRLSEINKNNILNKIRKFNSFISENDDVYFKKIEKYITKQWLYSVFINIDNKNIGNTERQILQYYFNNYIKKDINTYSCNSYWDYDIIRRYSKHSKELGISLPKYDIVEPSEEDSVNMFLPKSCQEMFFKSQYNYLNHKKDPQAENYRKILKEKFNSTVE